MPFFKSPTGVISEFTEEHANMVLRPQNRYVEVEAPKPEPVQPKVSKKKAKKSTD